MLNTIHRLLLPRAQTSPSSSQACRVRGEMEHPFETGMLYRNNKKRLVFSWPKRSKNITHIINGMPFFPFLSGFAAFYVISQTMSWAVLN